MPPDPLDRRRKKSRQEAVGRGPGSAESLSGQPAQIHFVGQRPSAKTASVRPQHPGSPAQVIAGRNFPALQKIPEEAQLQRRFWHERSVDVEEGDTHAASADLPARAGTVSRTKNFAPSITTGSPRSRQTRAAAQVNTCATE